MIAAADPEGRRAHDAYHRFFRAGRFSLDTLWKVLVVHLAGVLCPAGTLVLDVDDTLYKKSGLNVDLDVMLAVLAQALLAALPRPAARISCRHPRHNPAPVSRKPPARSSPPAT
jgi:hypothetical protein